MPKERVRPHPLDDPTMPHGRRVMRDICSRMIRTTREQVGWTQKRLSDRSGVSLSTVSKAEQCRQNLSMDTLVELMSAMGFGIGLVAYTDGDDAVDMAERVLGLDLQESDDEDDHEEDDPPEERTEEEIERELVREITRPR